MNFRYLEISNLPSPQLLELLSNNIVGTPQESILYQHQDVINKVKRLVNPNFISLSRGGNIIGTCCFSKRETINRGFSFNSFYIRYFTFKDRYRRKTSLRKIKNTPNSKIKEEINELLTGKGIGINEREKFFHYAYVDPKNSRSSVIVKEYGFTPIREFNTILFNRFYPKSHSGVHQIEESQIDEIRIIINKYYKDYTLFSLDNFEKEQYFIIKNDKGVIVAGAQANLNHWKIFEMPGLKLKFLSKLPFINRVINQNYHFLTFDLMFCEEGNEVYLECLFEDLLAKFKVYSAMTWADKKSNLFTLLRSIKLGLVDKLNGKINVEVIARFKNFSESEIEMFNNYPAYISAIDQT